jgi:hypothetical protein
MARQAMKVFKRRMMDTKVQGVTSGNTTPKDASKEAMRDRVTNVEMTHYIIDSTVGPHPSPTSVRDSQAITGKEIRAQSIRQTERKPDLAIACVDGGSNASGTFRSFIDDTEVAPLGVEAGGAARIRTSTAPHSLPGLRVYSTAPRRSCCRPTGDKSRRRTTSAPGRTTPTCGSRPPTAPSKPASRTRRRSRARRRSSQARTSSPRWRRRTPCTRASAMPRR